MATLDSSDFEAIRRHTREDPTALAVFKSWGLSKPIWYSLFQATEDWFINGFSVAPTTSFKATVEGITGACTNNQAKQVGYVWMGWRHDRNP